MSSKRISIFLALLISAFVVAGLLSVKHKEQQKREYMAQLQQQARPYELQRDKLLLQIAQQESDFSENAEQAAVVFAYQIFNREDLSYALSQSKAYGFLPSLVVDCSVDDDLMEAARQTGFELILTSNPFQSTAVNNAILHAPGAAFLLRNYDDSAENVETLKKLGVSSIIRYYGNYIDKLDSNNIAGLAYAMITTDSEQYENLVDRVQDAKVDIVFVADMQKTRDGSLTNSFVERILSILQGRQKKKALQITTVQEAAVAIRMRHMSAQERKALFERYQLQQEAQIKELEQIIRDIYSQYGD